MKCNLEGICIWYVDDCMEFVDGDKKIIIFCGIGFNNEFNVKCKNQ